MSQTLYLTKEERAMFEKLPAAVREGAEIKEETLQSYETDEALRIRMEMARFHKYPEVQKMLEAMKKGTTPDKFSLEEFPPDIVPRFFFTIGARGISLFIEMLLSEMKDQEDVQGLAILAEMRHDILETNAAISQA